MFCGDLQIAARMRAQILQQNDLSGFHVRTFWYSRGNGKSLWSARLAIATKSDYWW